MGTVNKFGKARLLDPANEALTGQARVNAEIFTAVEILGRKLERSEAERDRLARRLALIESSATVDEKTGRLYLPMVMETPARGVEYAAPKWMVAASLMSCVIALFALGLVLFREPSGPVLTAEQVAILNALKGTHLAVASPERGRWQYPDRLEPEEVEPAAGEKLPDESELARLEKAAEVPQTVVETPAPAPAVETPPVRTAAVAPEHAIIPGEDTTIDKPIIVKKEETVAPPPPQVVVKKKTPAVVMKENEDDVTPDANLPEKLADLEKRALQGIPEAQHDLATLYASGKVVARNYPRAIHWFTQAAEGGVANAYYNLGVIHHQGLGVSASMPKAIDFYEKAAELGHPEAMYNLGIAFIEGVGTKPDVERGVAYFKRAAKAGVAQAAYNLGVLYESNFIGPIDADKALEWYQAAADQGHGDAKVAVNRLKGTAAGDQALTLADMVEPAAGEGEEYGEGDASPASERPRPVTQGSTQDLLADIQQLMIEQGVLPAGQADGLMSPQTQDAIRLYQKKLGLAEDGLPSRELFDKIRGQTAAVQ